MEPDDDIMPAIIVTQAFASLAVNVLAMLVHRVAGDGTDTSENQTQCEVVAGALIFRGRIYIPAVDSLR